MRKVRKLSCFVLFFIMILNLTSVVGAVEEVPQRTVKVGFFSADGYHIMDEDGTMSGYGYDFLQMMLRYNNWKYEYVGYDKNWGDMLSMLKNGEIDMVTLANKTPEREEEFDFSEKSIGTSSTIMSISAANTKIVPGEYDTYDGAVIGLVEGSSHNEKFQEYAKEKGIQYTTVYYSDIADLLIDLRNGNEIDIAVTSNMRLIHDEVILDEFNATEYYVIVRKGDQALLEEVNRGISQLNVYSPDWRTSLFQKYYSDINSKVISFSLAEREYMQQLKDSQTVIKATMNPELRPYSYYENGVAKGIAPEVFKKIAENLGIQYEILQPSNRWEYKEQLNSGEADIDLTAYLDYSLAQKYNLKETDAYMNSAMAMLNRKDSNTDTKDMVVAIVKDPTEYIGYNNDLIYKYQYKEYDSVQECIDAVKNKEVDATFRYVYIAEQAVRSDYTNKLQYTILSDYSFGLCIGVVNESDYRLLAILNKGVNSLSSAFTQGVMLEEGTKMEENTPLLAVAYDHPIFVMSIIGILVFVICFMVILLLINRAQKIKIENSEALKDALEAAQSASRAKGVFLSNMSHEIRTPLNAILGYLSIAKDSDKNIEKMLHCIENGEIAAKHLLQIINDILDMSSIESGKLKIAHEDFDLKREITDITAIFYQNAKAKGVQFETKVEDLTQERVIGDCLRLNQILMNLLSNAIKFTPKNGSVNFKVRQLQLDEKRVYIEFTIRDTGIGMSQEYQSRLFHPFEQESASTARKYGGSGLGLSITNHLVSMMGGTIEVKSEQNIGTTFTVTLFFEKSNQVETVDLINKDYSNVRTLVVDDQKDEGTYVKMMLKRCGVKADIVTSGLEALKRIKGRAGGDYEYNLCILDWSMPQMNGIDTARKIREELDGKIPIIIATAYDITEIEEEAKRVGVNKVVSKPLFQSTLFDLLVSTFGAYHPEGDKKEEKKEFAMSGVHVLLAEDNEMNMEIAVTVLEKAGAKVDQARNGQEAYDLFLASPKKTYDFILMDIQMPVLDGYEATKKIRSSNHPDAMTIPIVAMTANAFAEDISEALAKGMNAHIAKPVNYDKLFETLQKFVKISNI